MRDRRRKARSKKVLGWTGLVYALATVALAGFMDVYRPGWLDHQYQRNVESLEKRSGAETEVALVLGSSRMAGGFKEQMTSPVVLADGRRVIACNFAHNGAGPLLNLVDLKRLLRKGIEPKWLVMEIMPLMLTHQQDTDTLDLALTSDLPILARHIAWPPIAGRYLRVRLNPFYRYRDQILGEMMPAWLPEELQPAMAAARELGGQGKEWSAEQKARKTAEAKKSYFARAQKMVIAQQANDALHEILEICRARRIPAVLVLSPEGTVFRSWYSAESLATLEGYVRGVSRQYDVPVVDARGWMADEDFYDQHHLTLAGAQAYTPRLFAEVLAPLIHEELGMGVTVGARP